MPSLSLLLLEHSSRFSFIYFLLITLVKIADNLPLPLKSPQNKIKMACNKPSGFLGGYNYKENGSGVLSTSAHQSSATSNCNFSSKSDFTSPSPDGDRSSSRKRGCHQAIFYQLQTIVDFMGPPGLFFASSALKNASKHHTHQHSFSSTTTAHTNIESHNKNKIKRAVGVFSRKYDEQRKRNAEHVEQVS